MNSKPESFLTIERVSQGEYKDKGSKFISYAYPASSENEIKSILQDLKRQYWDASHHCYAYMLGADHKNFRANDAGEPNHSAGEPILSQIRSLGLTDVLVVVVRYFGGTKLGISGLITAYKAASRLALEGAVVVEIPITINYLLEFQPDQMSLVMKSVKKLQIVIVAQHYDELTLLYQMSIRIKKKVEGKLEEFLGGHLGIKITRCT